MEPATATAPDQSTTEPPELWSRDRLADYLGDGERLIRRICEEAVPVQSVAATREQDDVAPGGVDPPASAAR
jgi:hypothetical protein